MWNNALRHYTGYESRDLEPCVRQLLAVHSSAHLNPHFEVRRFGPTRRYRLCARALEPSGRIFGIQRLTRYFCLFITQVVKKKFDSSEACHVCDIAALRDSDLIFL